MIPRHLRQTGFTLVEMAIVLLIVALLLGGGLAVFSAQIEQQKFKDTQKSLEDAKEALIGFAASHAATDGKPYLPCPDKTTAVGAGTANDGQEDRAVGVCVVTEGNLPWITLGIAGADGWGNRLRYRVTLAFRSSTAGMQLSSLGTLTVNNELAVAVATAVPAVILSHGSNGYGATSSSGAVIAQPPAVNIYEINNANAADDIFISSSPIATGGTGGEFDDIVTWLPATILFNRMLQAGKLP
ncbi:MAG: prepilin-type N-terminal cleavage/methylation domain-containing protein [Sulfuritalea sp.]|nr:prepilin-type N-terminal cleavage/methylation domain-containing protein [Sulfuritalea sp.]